MTTLAAQSTARPRPRLVSFVPDDGRRGRINAAAFGAIVFFGLVFPMAAVLPGATLFAGEAVALVLATFAAGRLTGATDRVGWIRSAAWVTGAVIVTAVVIVATFAFLAWGPLAP